MHLLTQLFDDAPLAALILGLLQLAFAGWMMIDAYHRRVETFWYWVILWFQPVGPWVYFFALKFRTPSLRGGLYSGDRKLSLVELRFTVEQAPTVANRFALAERLMETGAHAEAIPLLEAVLAIEPNYCSVLHALAKCRLAMNNPDQALAPLQRLMARDNRWSNYLAWHTLVEVHMARGQPAEALATCRELVKYQPTLENKCLLAEQLLGNDRPSEAAKVLRDALEEHRFTPLVARWHNRHWARQARRLREEAESGEKAKVAAKPTTPNPTRPTDHASN